jgi:hypothetical protein
MIFTRLADECMVKDVSHGDQTLVEGVGGINQLH